MYRNRALYIVHGMRLEQGAFMGPVITSTRSKGRVAESKGADALTDKKAPAEPLM